MKLRYTTRAKDELESALVWYEKQRKGLGLEFLDCIEAATQSIKENPNMYRIYYSVFHGCVIRRFPFLIFYTIEDKEIIIHSIFDSRQCIEHRPKLSKE